MHKRLIGLWQRQVALLVVCLLLQAQATPADLVVMTSGTFTAAHLELAVDFQRSTHITITTAATTMGVGVESIPSRLQRGEPVDVVIVASDALDDMIKSGTVVAGSRFDLAQSGIGLAVLAGAPLPDIGSLDALSKALLNAKSVDL